MSPAISTAAMSLLALALIGAGCSKTEPAPTPQRGDGAATGSRETAADSANRDADSQEQNQQEQPQTPQQEDQPVEYVLIKTSMGDIAVALDRERAPITVENFLSYVDRDHYDGTVFHRVIPRFMIQGGGLRPDLTPKPTDDPITNEWDNGLLNTRGTIAMARLNSPDSATAQFFINVADNSQNLSVASPMTGGAGYAVFGQVIAGIDVVDRIVAVPTTTRPGGHENVPREPVLIEDVQRISEAEAEELRE